MKNVGIFIVALLATMTAIMVLAIALELGLEHVLR